MLAPAQPPSTATSATIPTRRHVRVMSASLCGDNAAGPAGLHPFAPV
jgi:hypothetical protein